MDTICKHGKAKHFSVEKNLNGEFSSCCHKVKLNLPPVYVKMCTLKILQIQKTLKKS